jgi:hypothetical protein
MALQSFVGPRSLFPFTLLILHTVGRAPWTGDQPVTRPQATHRINAHHTDIHALSGIRNKDPRARASEDSLCFSPRGYCDWHFTDVPSQ